MNDTADRPAAVDKINLIRSIVGHAAGRETEALTEIHAVLLNATLEQIATWRGAA